MFVDLRNSFLLFLLFFLCNGCLFEGSKKVISQKTCLHCHPIFFKGVHENSFLCIDCHQGRLWSFSKEEAHQNLISSPSSDLIYQACKKCHAKEIERFFKGLHFTYKNMISKTFQSFNLNLNLSLHDLKFLNTTLERKKLEIENLEKNDPIEIKKIFIVDFFRRRCLSCHIEYEGENYEKTRRAKGCLACHFHKILEKPYEKFFEIKKPEDEKCLTCHYSSYIGWDYYGYFPHNWYIDYRSPFIKGVEPERPYGIEFYLLVPSVHKEKNLKCRDCHKKEETMYGQKKVSCNDCHKKLSLKFHNLSLLSKVRCEVCHVNFVTTEKLLECVLEFDPDFNEWIDIAVQESWEIENYFEKRTKGLKVQPKMKDKLNMEDKEGLWLCKNSGRFFEITEYGKDQKGKVCILRKRDVVLKFKEDVIVKGTFRKCVVPHSIGKGKVFGGIR